MRMILSRNGAATPKEPHPEMIRQCQKLQKEARPGSGPKLPWELLSKDKVRRRQALLPTRKEHKLLPRQERWRQGLGVRCSVQWRSLANILQPGSMRTEGQQPDGLCSMLGVGGWAFSVSVFTALTQDHSAVTRKKASLMLM